MQFTLNGVTTDKKGNLIVAVRTVKNGQRYEKKARLPANTDLAEVLKVHQRLTEELNDWVTNGYVTTKITFKQYARKWLEHVKTSGRVRGNSHVKYETYLKQYWIPKLGDIQLAKIKQSEVTKVLEDLSKEVAHNTLKGVLAVLRTAFNDAASLVDLQKNPLIGFRLRIKGKEEKERFALTQDEQDKLLASVKRKAEIWPTQQQLYVWLVVAFSTGMRFSEQAALEWKDVDFQLGLISINKSVSGQKIQDVKTQGSKRFVNLTREATEVLLQWKKDKKHSQLIGDKIFHTAFGKYLLVQYVNKCMKRHAGYLGIKKNLASHVARRTVNTKLVMALGAEVARKVIGHVAGSGMTEHYLPSDLGTSSAREKVISTLEGSKTVPVKQINRSETDPLLLNP